MKTISTLSLALLSFVLVLSSATAAERPNVILLMADDLGWGETHYNGHPQLQTPTLDEMAADGLRLDRFYAASPVCSPTRASVMTGRHANRSGAFAPNWSTRPEEVTIAQVVKAAGYRTGHFGKWHIGAVKKDSPLNPNRMGFDEYLAHDNYFEMNPPLSRNGETPKVIQGESSEIIIGEAINFIKKVQQEKKPFFTVVWFGSPHGPYSGIDSDVAKYADVLKEEMQHRFAEITAMDRAIGTLRKALKESGLSDNTLVWFNSDNGIPVANENDSFNGGWRGKKGDLHEGGLRVPGLIEWPAVITKPRSSDVACVTSDIMPTVLDLLGLKHLHPDRPLDGISLRSLIVDGAMKERPSPIGFWKYWAGGESKNVRWVDKELSQGTTPTVNNPAIDFQNFKHPNPKTSDFRGQAAWTENRYKLVVNEGKKSPELELFDLIVDPYEKTNLAEKEPTVVARMLSALNAWQTSVEKSLSGADYTR